MATKLRNKQTGETLTTPYCLECAYEPWEIVSDIKSTVAIQRLLKKLPDEGIIQDVAVREREKHRSGHLRLVSGEVE